MNYRPAPIDDTYADVRALVGKLSSGFAMTYGTDWDETVQAAGLGFCRAYHTYDPSLGYEFNTWVGEKVYYSLLDLLRQRARHPAFDRSVELTEIASAERTFSLFEFLDSLSDDAKTVVYLATSPPPKVLALVKGRKKPNVTTIGACVRQFLKDSGWTAARVCESFQEIKRAL